MNPWRQPGAVSLNCSDPRVEQPTLTSLSEPTGIFLLARAMTQLHATVQNKTHPLLGIENVWELFTRTGPTGKHGGVPLVPDHIKSGN